MKPDWYPDWRGDACVIVAAGPSAANAPLRLLRGRARFAAVNRSIELCPWADVLYGADKKFWDHHENLWRGFDGLKVTQHEGLAAERAGIIHRVKLSGHWTMLPGVVGGGGNSGFQLLNLVAQFGANPIILVGFDMHDRAGVHWHGPHKAPLHNPGGDTLARWVEAFTQDAPLIAAAGIEIINATPASALTCFSFRSLEDIACSLKKPARVNTQSMCGPTSTPITA